MSRRAALLISIAIIALFSLAAIAMFTALPYPQTAAILKEHGIVEMASAAGYLVAAVLLLVLLRPLLNYWPQLVFLLAFAARELDLDARFTTMKLTKSRFYLSDQVPWPEKIIGILVFIVLLTALGWLIKHFFYWFRRNILKLHPVAVYTAAGMGLLVVTKTIDGSARKLGKLGVEFADSFHQFLGVYEETMELAIPLFFCIAIITRAKLERA